MRGEIITITVDREYVGTAREVSENKKQLIEFSKDLNPTPAQLIYGPLMLVAGEAVLQTVSFSAEDRGGRLAKAREVFKIHVRGW